MAKQPKQTGISVDPLVRARAREAAPIPAPIIPALPPVDHNSPERAAIDALATALARIDTLDREIGVLNARKSELYRELRGQGFDVATVRRVARERRIDPILRADRQALFDAYWGAVGQGDSAGDA